MARTNKKEKECVLCRSKFMAFNCETLCSPDCKRQDKLNKKVINMSLEKKTCITCNTEFSIDYFYITNKETNLRCKHCKYCIQHRNQTNLINNPKRKSLGIKYRARWANENPEKVRNRYLKRSYGITIEDYDTILKEQNGVCAICEKEEAKKSMRNLPKRLAVDHCHTTGKVRGLLCFHCNSSIGKFKEDVDSLKKAINYLLKHRSKNV